jgi:hypothetical protein
MNPGATEEAGTTARTLITSLSSTSRKQSRGDAC